MSIYQFRSFWVSIPTIEDSSQIFFPDKYEIQLIVLIRETLEQAQPPSQEDYLKELLRSTFSIFKRIGLYLVNVHYNFYSKYFWSWDTNPLKQYELKHEIYELLKNNNNNFAEEELLQLTKWIDELEYKPKDNEKEDQISIQKTEAYKKIEWLTAVIENDYQPIKELYEKYSKVYPHEIEHPGYIIWSSGVQVHAFGESKQFPEGWVCILIPFEPQKMGIQLKNRKYISHKSPNNTI
jgi:hypothetical protein